MSSDRNSTKSFNICVSTSCACSNGAFSALLMHRFAVGPFVSSETHDGRSPYAPLRPRSLSRCLACRAASCSSLRAWDSASSRSSLACLSSDVSGGGGSAGAGAAGASSIVPFLSLHFHYLLRKYPCIALGILLLKFCFFALFCTGYLRHLFSGSFPDC